MLKATLKAYKESVATAFAQAADANAQHASFDVVLPMDHPYNPMFIKEAAEDRCATDRKYCYEVNRIFKSNLATHEDTRYRVCIVRRARVEDQREYRGQASLFGSSSQVPTAKMMKSADVFDDDNE